MEWTAWNWVNVFFMFFSGYLAISCWKEGNNMAGHLNAFACAINTLVVISKLGF